MIKVCKASKLTRKKKEENCHSSLSHSKWRNHELDLILGGPFSDFSTYRVQSSFVENDRLKWVLFINPNECFNSSNKRQPNPSFSSYKYTGD